MKRILILIAFVIGLILSYVWYVRSPKKLKILQDSPLPTGDAITNPYVQDTADNSALPNESPRSPLAPASSSFPSNATVVVTNREHFLASLYQTPIDFYGRVVDERSNGIHAAQIRLSVSDKPPEGNTVYERLSDDQGFFSLTGARGASIAVTALKEGYYPLQSGSIGFKYAPLLRDPSVVLPTPDAPAILVLKRKGIVETLVHFPRRSFPLSKDGTPLEINLAASGMPPGIVRVEAWTSDHAKNTAGRYDWKCRLSVPTGGLIDRKGPLDFEAPPDRYQEFFEFAVLADAPD